MDFKKILFILRALFILSLLILFTRLFELQIIKGNYYKELADGNRIRSVTIKAPRGEILARGGEYLARNIPEIASLYYKKTEGYFVSFEKVTDAQKISDVKQWRREYPLKAMGGHITGYLGIVNENELEKVDSECIDKGVRSGTDLVGRSGLEGYYDCQLRGSDGEILIEVEADGSFVRELGERSTVQGNDLKTTIDYPLQEYISGLLNGYKGGIIVSGKNGEILGLYSSPGFDPNIFQKNNRNEINTILKDSGLPIFNRVISGKYTPGSIFKPLVAIAALETGSINENYRYNDTGKIIFNTPYGNYSYSNWYYLQYGGSEGSIDVKRALARSTDTFFYKVGELTGVDNEVEWANKFGLSSISGIDLNGEIAGFVPDPNWKEDVRGERWYLGNTYHLSIGQGDLAITPVGIHNAISAIAYGGKICTPHLILTTGGKDISNCRDLSISANNIDIVKAGMESVCKTGGTGYTFFDFKDKYGIDVACKTGTAQLGSDANSNAWFTAFAPVEDPQIIVTVLVEQGGEGSKVAGPIARNIFDFWFKNNLISK